MIFELDAEKAKINFKKHGVSFDEAHSANEPRYNLIGLTAKGLLFVVYAEPDENTVRLISARTADKFEEAIYVAK